MLLAQDVLHAYTMISISIMVVFTSLMQPRGRRQKGEGDDIDKARDMSHMLQGENGVEIFNCVCVCVFLLT